MAITPLGLVGNAAGGGTSLVVPITVNVPASTPAVGATLCLLFARSEEDPGAILVSDTAGAPAAPYTCFAANIYGPTEGGVAPGRSESEFWMGLVLAPLTAGVHAIHLNWSNPVAFWRVAVLAYTGAHSEATSFLTAGWGGIVDGRAWSGPEATKVGTCYQLSWTPAACDRIVLMGIENETGGVSALTYVDATTTVREQAYNEGPHSLSQVLGERPASGGAEQIGVCTDVLPAFDTQFGGNAIAMVAGVGPAACSVPTGVRSCCGSRCPCKPCAR